MSGLTGRAVYGAVGKTFVKELSYDIAGDVIGSGTSSFVFDLTGNVNLSRLAGLSAGMMTSGNSGKTLNHVDNVTSSTVKGLNNADNFTSTNKKFDRFADASKNNKVGSNKINSVQDIKGEDWCRCFREKYGTNNVVWENATPSQLAKSWQGSGRYPGVDEWKPKLFKKGDIIYRGEPNGTEFFTTKKSINSVDANQVKLFEGLQVEPHPILGYRSEMQGYKFTTSFDGAEARCLANPDYGSGGLVQNFIPNANDLIDNGVLVFADKIILNK